MECTSVLLFNQESIHLAWQLLTEEVPFISTPGDNTTFSNKWSSEPCQGLATCIKRETGITTFSVIFMLSLLDHNMARILICQSNFYTYVQLIHGVTF